MTDAFVDQMEVDHARDMARKEQMRRLRDEIQCFLREQPRVHVFTKDSLEYSAAQLGDEMQALDRRWD